MRLTRVGKKKQPSYRIVVMDSRSPRDGAYIDRVGFYNPRTDPPTIEVDTEKASKWLQNGVQPSDAVRHMLRKLGVLESDEKNAGAD
jgi:small subunit ribosomal protein S16